MANSFEYVQVTGTGFLPTETNGVVKSSQVLCIFNTDRVNHFVTVAKIIDDTQLKWYIQKNKDVPTFKLHISKNYQQTWQISSLLTNTEITVYDVPEIQKVAVTSSLTSSSEITHKLALYGFHLLTINEFSYSLKWNGFGEPAPISIIDDFNAEVTLLKTSLSTSKAKCHVLPTTSSDLPKIATFTILNIHFHGVEVYKSEISYVIEKVYDGGNFVFCGLTLYESSADATGTAVGINTEGCVNSLSEYTSLNHLVPFEVKTSVQTPEIILSPNFSENTKIDIPDEDVLKYIFGADWYWILNKANKVPFIEALWALEDLNPYYKYEISIDKDIYYTDDIIKANTNSTRIDTFMMQYTDVSDSSVASWPCTQIGQDLTCTLWMTAASSEGRSFYLSILNSIPERVDNGNVRIISVYPTPVVTALKLYARAHLVNGSYPQYPELEFVEVSIQNTNSVEMQTLPLRCRTKKLHFNMNVTWIDDTTLVCRTHSALYIDNFCIELSYDAGSTWSSDWDTQKTLLDTEMTQLLWKSQSFYLENSGKAVQYNMVCFWHISPLEDERCSDVDGNKLWTNPAPFVYSSSDVFTSSQVPGTYCDISGEEDNFVYYKNLHNLEWIIPTNIYQSGARENIRLFGSNFKEISTCSFEVSGVTKYSTPVFYDDTYVEWELPDFSDIPIVSMVDVLVGLPQFDGTLHNNAKVKLHVVKNPTILEIYPTKGFSNQEREIKITGLNFLNFETLHVKGSFVGDVPDILLEWLVVSDEVILIKAPNALNIALYKSRIMYLHVSSNGMDYSSEDTFIYTYMDEPHITSLSVSEADYEGNTNTEAIGLFFTDDVTEWVFDNIYVPATYISSTNIGCSVPPYDRYIKVSFKLIFFDNYEVNNTEVYFTYQSLNIIDDFNPKQGHIDGGIEVVITGTFVNLDVATFRVLFGNVEATSVVMDSDYQMTVVAPAVPFERKVEIFIETPTKKYGTGSVNFQYRDYFKIFEIEPISGPSRGGTVVKITYFGTIYDPVYWVFGTKYSAPVFITSTRVDCKTPPNRFGEQSVSLTLPGIFTSIEDIKFTYVKDISVLLIDPLAVPLGGETEITVKGLNFLPVTKVKITEFGEMFDITQINAGGTEIKFIAPSSESVGEKKVFLTNNGVDFYQRFDYPLIYYNGIIAVSITPDKILIGSYTEVTIKGTDFQMDSRFNSVVKVNGAIIKTTVIDSETMTCILPPFPTLIAETTFDLFLTVNLQDYYTGLTVTYILPPTITSVQPLFSGSQEQYFSTKVIGNNFIHSSGLLCKIGEYSSYTIMFLSSQEILCFFSTIPAGLYEVQISNNFGFDYTVFNFKFQVSLSLQVTDAYPKVISAKGGIIFLKGNGFKEGIKCVFEVNSEGYTFDEDNIVDAKLINGNLVICKMPDMSFIGSGTLLIKASLSNNLRLVSQSNAEVKILDKSPKGFYFSDNAIRECPQGSYCSGKGKETAIRCPIGFYADKKRSERCKPWDKNLCPFGGLSESLKWPSGYVCDSFLLHYPHKPCTAGNFWPIGTQEYDKVNPIVDIPIPCEKQSYCKSGAKSGVVLEGNSTSAQIWKRGFVCPRKSQSAYGIGECPTGHYCPQAGHPGIPCPPRTYWPGRGNLNPLNCPKGSFNYHYGQSNCTICSIGYICPVEGLFSPILCPAGVVCNLEGLIYPYYLCPPGLICKGSVKSGVKLDDRSCKMLQNIEDTSTECEGGKVYYKNAHHLGLQLEGYGLNITDYVWCWGKDKIMDYIPDIGRMMHERLKNIDATNNMTTVEIFYSYADMFTEANWDGMKIIAKAVYDVGLNDTDDTIDIPIKSHKKLIEDYLFNNMYTTYKAELWPGGFFWLEGVISEDVDDNISTPYLCPGGSYWLPGSDTAIGTGFCPPGFYCPEGSENAIPTPPGFFTPTSGSIIPIACYPGFFTLEEESTEWSRCPNGFQCKGTGTSWPTICPVGYYRSSSESNAWSICPVGTFSIERGLRDKSECISCPEGRLCSKTGLTNITESDSCIDGAIWDSATGARSTITCPKGFFCPGNTGINDMYVNTCPAGFYCESGTGDGSKYNKKCPEGYYCPTSTGAYDEFLDSSAESTAPTKWPRGTGDDNEDGKRELTDCTVDSRNKLLTIGDIRVDDTTDSTDTTTSDSTRRNLINELKRTKRHLQTSTAVTELEDKLNDITEIEISLHAYLDSNGGTTDDLTSYINLNREYLTRWNPINGSLNEEIIFDIPALSYALVTMDLRALKTQYRNFTYYEDWAISFTIDDDITEGSRAQPVEMPEMFLRTQNEKNDVLEFQIFAWTDKKLRVDILLYNGLFFNLKYMFLNSAVVQIRSPNRAKYGSQKTFVAILQNEYNIGLPINSPKLQEEDTTSLPEYSVTYASNNDYVISNKVKNRVETLRGKNIWVPASLYWQERESISLPYLPYFSNCKGYGQYIPIWGVTEEHHEWELIPVEDTVFMHEYSLRSSKADNCEDIKIQWVYDEIWNDDQQTLTRWFEIDGEESLFDFSVEPISADEIGDIEFDENDVLPVAPEEAAGDLNTAPQSIELGIFFYQYSKTDKRLITVGIAFDDLKSLTAEEKAGEKDIPYDLTFNYQALSHTDLTIAFAFEWHFYLVLYLIIGTLSIFIIIIFLLYHRIVTRGKAVGFKFFSNLKLMLPPAAYGVSIAMFPLVLVNLFIATLMIGKVLNYQTRLFGWEANIDDTECPFSLFDFIKDDPNNVEVDYVLLRSGRAGLAFWVVGVYLMWLGLKILIPEKASSATDFVVPESYDANVWEFFTWKRSNVLFISIFWIFYNLVVVQFSFSDTFSVNIWYMIGLIKVLGVIFGFILEILLEEALLSSPMEILGGLTQGLVTFGADDFVDFLNAYFIELGIMMFERTYVGDFVNIWVNYIESRMSKLMDFKFGWFSSNDDFVIDKEMKKETESLKQKKKEAKEAELFKENKDPQKKEDEANGKDPKDDQNIVHNDIGSSGSDIYVSDVEDELEFYESDQMDDSDHEIDYNDSMNDEKVKPVKKEGDSKDGKKDVDDESDFHVDENIEVQEVEPLLESFKGYANDTIVLFINPLFIALIWVFYDETQVANEYGIRTQDFLYYFMFSVVIIPFQIVIDVFFQNIVEWYFKLPVHDYLDYLHFRFASRTTRWKGNEDTPNLRVGVNLVSLDQLCFSSQYYFVQTIYSFGMTQLLLGIHILLNYPDYNVFSDSAALLIVAVMIAVCMIIQKLCILLGTLLRIWKVNEKKLKKEEMTLKEQFLKVLNVDQYMKNKGLKMTPIELHFSKQNWEQIENWRANDEVAMVDLKTDRVVARTVRDKFIRYNKPWLRENMHEIFTPRTLFLYRKEIINQFEKVVGKKQAANISFSSKERSTFSKGESNHDESMFYENFQPKYMTEKTKQIIRFWIWNAKATKIYQQKLAEDEYNQPTMEKLAIPQTKGLLSKIKNEADSGSSSKDEEEKFLKPPKVPKLF